MTGFQLGLGLVLLGAAGAMVVASLRISARRDGVAKIEAGEWFWVIVLAFFGVMVLASHWENVRPAYQPPAIPGGYENPAPGDDGSYDCPPGGAPVYVGSNDPAGLDGDGDGIGCE